MHSTVRPSTHSRVAQQGTIEGEPLVKVLQVSGNYFDRPFELPLVFLVFRSPFRQLLGFHLVLRLDLSKGKRLQHNSRAGVTACLSVSTIFETIY